MMQKLSPDREIQNIEQCLLNYVYLGQACPEDLRQSIQDVLAVEQKKQQVNFQVQLFEVVNIP